VQREVENHRQKSWGCPIFLDLLKQKALNLIDHDHAEKRSA
jgi:hypothetical protein